MAGLDDIVDLSEPQANDISLNAQLYSILHSLDNFQPEQEAKRRKVVLGKISELFRQWCYRTIVKKPGMNQEMAQAACGKIFTFGSYRLGVHGPGTDIDILCVAPRTLTRSEFQKEMYQVLKRQPSVSKITAVFKAKVPLIKMVFDSVPIDLLFASLQGMDRIGDQLNDLMDDIIIDRCDQKTVFSLNGPRNTDKTLSIVPNLDNFRMTLRVIRLWAKRRGLYSNVLGYPGGAAWSILVAKICKMYPNFIPSQLVRKFFMVYKMWDWNQAVFLCQVEQMNVNTPQPGVMNVMTPAFPSYNSTMTVNKNTLKAICDELYIANIITEQVQKGNANWLELFEPVDFFDQFNRFIKVPILARNANELQEWEGFVLSKMRVLFQNIDRLIPAPYLRPNPKQYPIQDPNYPYSVCYYAGVKFIKQPTTEPNQSVDFNVPFQQFAFSIHEDKLKNRYPLSMNIRIQLLSKDQIQDELFYTEPPTRKRFRKWDSSLDPANQGLLDSERNLNLDLLPDPVMVQIQSSVPVRPIAKKRLTFNLKKK